MQAPQPMQNLLLVSRLVDAITRVAEVLAVSLDNTSQEMSILWLTQKLIYI